MSWKGCWYGRFQSRPGCCCDHCNVMTGADKGSFGFAISTMVGNFRVLGKVVGLRNLGCCARLHRVGLQMTRYESLEFKVGCLFMCGH